MKITRVNKSIIIEQSSAETHTANLQRKTDLKHIIEVTQEHDANPSTQTDKTEQYQTKDEIIPIATQGIFKKYIGCVSNLFRKICYKPNKLELDVNATDFAKMILRIKKHKKCANPLLPPQKQPKKVLVLDLDETLIHSTFYKPEKYDYESEIVINGKPAMIYTTKRFGLQAFLFQMSKLYQIVIFTASQKLYADKIIDYIDPKKRISHRLYRQHCITVNKTSYLKNLSLLGRNLKQTIIVDDNNIAGLLQPENFYKIQPFQGNEKDRQLCRLSSFLKYLNQKNEIVPVKDQRKRFEEIQINLEEETIGQVKPKFQGRSLNQRKRQYSHKKTNSEVEALVVPSQTETEAETTASDLIKKL